MFAELTRRLAEEARKTIAAVDQAAIGASTDSAEVLIRSFGSDRVVSRSDFPSISDAQWATLNLGAGPKHHLGRVCFALLEPRPYAHFRQSLIQEADRLSKLPYEKTWLEGDGRKTVDLIRLLGFSYDRSIWNRRPKGMRVVFEVEKGWKIPNGKATATVVYLTPYDSDLPPELASGAGKVLVIPANIQAVVRAVDAAITRWSNPE